MIRTIIVIATALALAAALPAAPAHAQSTRTYVSAAGSDTNNCTSVTTPCRHFQAAVNATPAGGEVVALDPANYGSFTVGQAITINGQGWSYISPLTSGAAIAITANPGDSISLRGLSLNGNGVTGGTNGIVFNAGGSLTVADCVVQNFDYTGGTTTGNGIQILPTSGFVSFVIIDTVLSGNANDGILYFPPSGAAGANGVINHVLIENGGNGIVVNTAFGGGSTTVSISNAIISNNNQSGISANNSAALSVSIDNDSISGNSAGIVASNTSYVTLGRSVITANNNWGISNGTANTFYTYQDNRINRNGTDITGQPLISLPLQ
jgi:hypothetical protein